jgi:hypothetical protein
MVPARPDVTGRLGDILRQRRTSAIRLLSGSDRPVRRRALSGPPNPGPQGNGAGLAIAELDRIGLGVKAVQADFEVGVGFHHSYILLKPTLKSFAKYFTLIIRKWQ